ncbi:unnamed protein product [Rhodiola kirilowii]
MAGSYIIIGYLCKDTVLLQIALDSWLFYRNEENMIPECNYNLFV